MPIVDSQRLKGNQAAFSVSTWLSEKCLVRPVSDGTDVGIDLFCETVHVPSGQPFLHFWVQVKTGSNQVTIANGQAKCRFEKKHVDYWCRQPVPTYAFLVPEDQLTDLQKVYVVSFVAKRFKGEVPFDATKSKTLSSDFVCYANGGQPDLSRFAEDIVRREHAMMQIFRGVSEWLPEVSPGYVQTSPIGFRAGFGKRVAEQVRRSASTTLKDMLTTPKSVQIADRDREMAVLAAVLDPFTLGIDNNGYWGQHYEDYWALGLYRRQTGSVEAGNSLMGRAIEIIKGDDEFKRQVPSWEEIVQAIEADIAK